MFKKICEIQQEDTDPIVVLLWFLHLTISKNLRITSALKCLLSEQQIHHKQRRVGRFRMAKLLALLPTTRIDLKPASSITCNLRVSLHQPPHKSPSHTTIKTIGIDKTTSPRNTRIKCQLRKASGSSSSNMSA